MDYLTTSAFKLRSIVNTLWKNTCKSYNKHKNIEGADEKRETMVLKSIFQTDGQTDRQTWLSSVIWKQSTNILLRFYVVIFITSKNTSSTNDLVVVVFLYSFSKIIQTVWYVSLSFYCTILYDLNEQQFFHNWTIKTRGILEIYTHKKKPRVLHILVEIEQRKTQTFQQYLEEPADMVHDRVVFIRGCSFHGVCRYCVVIDRRSRRHQFCIEIQNHFWILCNNIYQVNYNKWVLLNHVKSIQRLSTTTTAKTAAIEKRVATSIWKQM